MLSDLDAILRSREIDAIVVPMHEAMHPSFRWISRGAKVTKGYVVKRPGEEPLLVHYPMERDEAAAAGIPTRSVHEFGLEEIFRAEADTARAQALFYESMFSKLGIRGTVAFAGNVPIELYGDTLDDLRGLGIRTARLSGENPILRARKRKDLRELGIIRSVGERTERVIDSVREVLRAATIIDGNLHHSGSPLTLGDLKTLVTRETTRLGMVEDHETILSQGHDAGVPHSRGDATAIVRASSPIILDIFPMDAATGYFFDTTRTFCVGPVPDELGKIHGLVLDAFNLAADRMRAGTKASDYQQLVCDFFESQGYPTIRSTPTTTQGYVHGLGHGVGLDVHEKPSFAIVPSNSDLVEVGDVLTIEPGLYFPERGIGVRIEDTFYVNDDGRVVTFCKGDRGLTP